ncbi:MAG TPA: hypothetical protein VH482_30005 [Thermomicrobiales bacterium]|jgi:hypothetical protein
MPTDAPPFLRRYLWVVGAGLLVQGTLTLVAIAIWGDAGAHRTHGILNHDARHGLLHVLWGLALLVTVNLKSRAPLLVGDAIVIGVFYLALGVLGIVTHDPFGLLLGPGENGFHLIVGGSALVVGLLALRAGTRSVRAELSPGLSDG